MTIFLLNVYTTQNNYSLNYWQNFAERIRELLFVAKQSMTAEQFARFRALVKMTFGTGYTTKLRQLLRQTPKEFLNFDEATL